MDFESGVLPYQLSNGLITATSSCIVVGTVPDVDGTVEIVILNSAPENPAELFRVYDSIIETPHREISVCTVNNEKVLEKQVKNTETAVQIWVDHDTWPAKVAIVVPDGIEDFNNPIIT